MAVIAGIARTDTAQETDVDGFLKKKRSSDSSTGSEYCIGTFTLQLPNMYLKDSQITADITHTRQNTDHC